MRKISYIIHNFTKNYALKPNGCLVYNRIGRFIYDEGAELMRMFEKWNQLQNLNCKVIINHALFDGQSYSCDMLQIINDKHRVGVVIKGIELFLYKSNVIGFWVDGNVYKIRDKIMEMHIIVNKM